MIRRLGQIAVSATAAMALALLTAAPADGAEWHVTTSGTPSGVGSTAAPWDLQTALSGGHGLIGANDTIWLHDGTYSNPHSGLDAVAWECTLTGTAASPIVVRAFPGAHPILDGMDSQQNDILRVSSSHVWYWGLEIMSSDSGRVDTAPQTAANDYGSYPSGDIKRGTGIGINQQGNPTGNKFISCIVHDAFIGFGSTNVNDNTQLYGCLFYNNGWFNSGGGGRSHHGHNIYVHNATGEIKEFHDCITWGAFENNTQAWSGSSTSDQEINDFFFDGQVSILYGPQVDGAGLILGNLDPTNPTVTNCMFYQPGNSSPTIEFAYNEGSGTLSGGHISGNYVYGGEVYFNAAASGLTFDDNFISSGFIRGTPYSGSGNTITAIRPTSPNVVFVRPSPYEAGRANVVVYNWAGDSSVSVDLSSVFNAGDSFSIIDVQNPSAAVLGGTYSGPVSIPMTGTAIAQPIGNDTEGRTHTPAEFGAFIAMGGTVAPPAPDAGMPPDASFAPDAHPLPDDAGRIAPDASPTPGDASSNASDAGSSPGDAGSNAADAHSILGDAGPVAADAAQGARDAGSGNPGALSSGCGCQSGSGADASALLGLVLLTLGLARRR